MILNEIKTFLGEDWMRTNDLVVKSLQSDIDLLNKTNEMLLRNSGKRLRPMITLLCARICSGGKTTEDSIRFAAATELLHNATLLHDDVADNSPERRGKPTVMSILGGNSSVLLGDFWLVKAVNNILESDEDTQDLIRIFAATLNDLAEGEMLQLQKSLTGDTSFDDYMRIIYCKTASLFCTSAIAGAMSVNAAKEKSDAVKEYAKNLGLAFQIRDDMFDYSGDDGIGKPVGIDLDEQKITLPLLCALDGVSAEEAASVRKKMVDIHENKSYKDEIRSFVFQHRGLDGAEAKLNEYIDASVRALSVFPDSEEKRYLIGVAKFTGARKA